MVVFICGSCNDALKKNAVEVHLSRCRSSVLSCCDCGKDFQYDSYKAHTQCISEDQKYGPQDQQSASANLSKGEKKRQEWLKSIKEAVSNMHLSGPAEMALNKLLEFENIPQKKPKFLNFAANCVKISNPHVLETLWTIIESAQKATADKAIKETTKPGNINQVNETQKTTEVEEEGLDHEEKETKLRKKKKRKLSETVNKSEDTLNETENGNALVCSGDVHVNVQDKENTIDQSNGHEEKKKKKKKKRDRQETSELEYMDDSQKQLQENDQGINNSENQDETSVGKSELNESDIPCRAMLNGDEDKNDQENIQNDADPENLKEKQIGWFKQLKRKIKEGKTVSQKDFKKMIKRLKKQYGLTESNSELISKARSKLMKRHNYIVSAEQIVYEHLF